MRKAKGLVKVSRYFNFNGSWMVELEASTVGGMRNLESMLRLYYVHCKW